MPAPRPSSLLAGIVLYSLGIFFFSVNDALGKWLVTDYGPGQLMALRALGAGLVLAVIAFRRPFRPWPSGQYGLHALRILCSAVDTFAFYAATRTLPLADVMTFYMAGPLIIVALSALLLGERVGRRRALAVAIGFVGVVVALHPGAGAFSPISLLALGGATAFALSIIITRLLRSDDWLALTAYQVVGTGIVGAVFAVDGWTMPGALDLGLMFAVGIVSMGCFMALTKALILAPASLLAPFQYAAIVWAAAMGWAVWGDVPGTPTLVGVAVIVVSGMVALRSREEAAPA